MEELIKRILSDIKKAEIRRDAFDKESNGYSFNHGEVIALKTVLFDMRELNLINSKYEVTNNKIEKIFHQFNLLSDSDFKSWMLNNYDELHK